MTNELKNGDMVYVSDERLECCNAETSGEYEFIAVHRGSCIVSTIDGTIFSYVYAVKIPEKKVIPWNFDTCPVPPFAIKNKSTGVIYSALTLYKTGIAVTTFSKSLEGGLKLKTWEELYTDYEHIPNQNNRNETLPCGGGYKNDLSN